jgi:hypothetical protein
MKNNLKKWAVSENGDLTYNNERYVIDQKNIIDDDWLLHIMDKNWIDLNDFIPAYFEALKRCGIKKQLIKISY